MGGAGPFPGAGLFFLFLGSVVVVVDDLSFDLSFSFDLFLSFGPRRRGRRFRRGLHLGP